MKKNQGFTLIELMVVIVIIGILSAVAIPKLFGMSAKAKVAEAPQTISTWSKLQEAYFMEKSATGLASDIGFKSPADSKVFSYADAVSGTGHKLTATLGGNAGDCVTGDKWSKALAPSATGGTLDATWGFPTGAGGEGTSKTTACAKLTPNFGS